MSDHSSTAQLSAYLTQLSELTAEQWGAARNSARRISESAQKSAERREAITWLVVSAHTAKRDNARVSAAQSARTIAKLGGCDAARRMPANAALAAEAIIVRDLITVEQFAIVTAAIKATGINFDTLDS